MTGAKSRRKGHQADHGTRASYRKGCRCEPCRRANADAELARKAAAGFRPIPTCSAPACEIRATKGTFCARHHYRATRYGDPMQDTYTLTQRLELGIDRTQGTCWVWTKAINGNGYGVAWDGERTVVAHRLAYEQWVGPIPDGLHIDHLCRNRACINPGHLEPVTQAENNRRANAIRWAR